MPLSKRKKYSTLSSNITLDTPSDFLSNASPVVTSTPKHPKLQNEAFSEMSLETIVYNSPKPSEISFNDNECTDSDDSEPFCFDKEFSHGLIEDVDNFDETYKYTDNSNEGNEIDDERFVAYNKAQYFLMRDMLVMIIRQHSTVYFEGLMSVTVLQGEVEVLGYTINKLSGTKELFSPRGCSRLYIKNKGNHVTKSKENIFSNLPATESFGDLTTLENIARKIKSTDAVLVGRSIKNHQVDFLVNHISQQIYSNSGSLNCTFDEDDENSIKVNPKWDEILEGVGRNSRILLAGGKSVGKSTMLRYMVNKLLLEYKEVLVIDLDPGQPEFTVPGCVSASVVTEPLLGPNFTHLRKPARCIFVPDIDLSEGADEYIGFVEFLMAQCENIPIMPTLINHMGFTRGLGFYILSAVVVCVQPTTIIDVRSSKNSRNYSESLSTSSVCENANVFRKKPINAFTRPNIITINSMSDSISRWQLEPRLIREMCVLNYFGTMISSNGMAITDIETFIQIINVTRVNILDSEGPTSLSTVNSNLVALCGSIYNSKCYNCFGWGIVRGINFENQDMYILTPVAQEVFRNVDTLILGSVTLPPSLLMNTRTVSGLIPYVADGVLSKLGELTKRSHIPRATKRGVFNA